MSTSNIGHLSENLYSESNILWTQFESASLLWTILQIVHPTQNGAIFELIIDLKYIMCSWQNLQGHVQNYLYNLDPPKLTLNFFMMDEIPPFANNVFIKKTVQHNFFWPSNFFLAHFDILDYRKLDPPQEGQKSKLFVTRSVSNGNDDAGEPYDRQYDKFTQNPEQMYFI